MADLLGISISGLSVSQAALRTAGHNITNANTEGYSRQIVDVNTRGSQYEGVGYVGNGATVASVKRVADDFLTSQLRKDHTTFSDLEIFNENIRELDTLLSDPDTGLSKAMQTFFSALQSSSDEPSSIPARELVVSEVKNLEVRFNTMHDRLSSLSNGIDQKLSSSVEQINSLASAISGLNSKIHEAVGLGANASPNDLLDQRDEALRQLSELVSITTFNEGQGKVNVLIGNGQPLVIGNEYNELVLDQSTRDFTQKGIFVVDKSGNQDVTAFLTGGQIGGALRFRDEVLGDAFNELGRLALTIADTFNTANKNGLTLNSEFGRNIFRDINEPEIARSRVIGDGDNSRPNDRIMSLEIENIEDMQASDYAFNIGGAGVYTITRLSDGVQLEKSILPGVFPSELEFDGLKLTIEQGTFAGGDSFLIRPNFTAARDFASDISRPEELAYASPVVTDTNIGNVGDGDINAGETLQVYDNDGNILPLFADQGKFSPPLLVRFTSENTYDILDNSSPGNPVDLNPPIRNQIFIPGVDNQLFSEDVGVTQVTSQGTSIGLPVGSVAVNPALVTPQNKYPPEILWFRTTDPETGTVTTQNLTTGYSDSARTTADAISNIAGATARASTYVELAQFDFNDSFADPTLGGAGQFQFTVNGEDLLDYPSGALDTNLPDPSTDPLGFKRYLADSINENTTLKGRGIYAAVAYDSLSGQEELRIFSKYGDNIDIRLNALGTDSMGVGDGKNPLVTMAGAGANTAAIVVGGSIDVTLDSNVTMDTSPVDSQLFGDSTDPNFARSKFYGIQASINGHPEAGDTFTLDFNSDAALDNRNALKMANLETEKTMDGGFSSYSDSYSKLVEVVGTNTSASEIDRNAAEEILAQTKALRDSKSGVNLDEEAAQLIKFEQLYNANSQVIRVARDLFDRLLSVF